LRQKSQKSLKKDQKMEINCQKKKLLAFNSGDEQRVEVVILSRNDPVSGLRVFRSAAHHGLHLERGVFTRGRPPYHYLRSLHANLFLSANTHKSFLDG
jgi:5'-nucleotidase